MVIKCYFKYICLASRKSYYSTPPFLPSPPTPHHPSPSTTTCLAYERSVGFASLQNSGRSTSGILARPLPKGAGLRQGSLVSNTTIIRDTRNVQISQTLSAVKTEGSPPRLSPLPQTPPTPHYPSPRTTQNPNLPPAAVTTIIHHSLFIKQKVRAFSDNGPRYKI